jgi:hypothetical protein
MSGSGHLQNLLGPKQERHFRIARVAFTGPTVAGPRHLLAVCVPRPEALNSTQACSGDRGGLQYLSSDSVEWFSWKTLLVNKV